jgi:Sec-independent protein translocase protein TatA
MGFHLLDLLPILLIGLALFGPKTLQSIARNTGKGVGQAKEMKDKLLSELPVEEITKITENIPRVPMNSQQAVQMLLSSAMKPSAEGTEAGQDENAASEARTDS